mmetsp:Transcript_9265/g.17726  ORF Transcript_9265/g.17726 Transcript_9265/m.17726 type:complete len:105 (+) Transcript_9265:639-953(+)
MLKQFVLKAEWKLLDQLPKEKRHSMAQFQVELTAHIYSINLVLVNAPWLFQRRTQRKNTHAVAIDGFSATSNTHGTRSLGNQSDGSLENSSTRLIFSRSKSWRW